MRGLVYMQLYIRVGVSSTRVKILGKVGAVTRGRVEVVAAGSNC